MNGCGFNIILNNYFGSLKNTLRYVYIALLPGATLRFDHILLFAEAGHYVHSFFSICMRISQRTFLFLQTDQKGMSEYVYTHICHMQMNHLRWRIPLHRQIFSLNYCLFIYFLLGQPPILLSPLETVLGCWWSLMLGGLTYQLFVSSSHHVRQQR